MPGLYDTPYGGLNSGPSLGVPDYKSAPFDKGWNPLENVIGGDVFGIETPFGGEEPQGDKTEKDWRYWLFEAQIGGPFEFGKKLGQEARQGVEQYVQRGAFVLVGIAVLVGALFMLAQRAAK